MIRADVMTEDFAICVALAPLLLLLSFMSHWLQRPPQRPPLAGHEEFVGMDATVQDFWRFAMSDLRMNNTRGYLAEFLVARAVGAIGQRVEWDAYDVLAPFGARIEGQIVGLPSTVGPAKAVIYPLLRPHRSDMDAAGR